MARTSGTTDIVAEVRPRATSLTIEAAIDSSRPGGEVQGSVDPIVVDPFGLTL